MNMKKITGVLVGAAVMMIGGNTHASGMVGSTEVPVQVTVGGYFEPIACTFTGNRLISDIAIGDVMGALECQNTNGTPVVIGLIPGGTYDLDGRVELKNGKQSISGKLKDEGNMDMGAYTIDADSSELQSSGTVPGGGRKVYNLKAAVAANAVPSGAYNGSIVIGTWAG